MNFPIQVQGLSKSFGTHTVLDRLDWAIAPGTIVGLLGRNGAGKSTLIECLLGLRDFQGGAVRLFGEPAGQLSAAAKARIGYVPQAVEIFGWLTARQLFAYFRSMYTQWNEGKIASLMQSWDLPYDKPISKLSVGQKQRLSIIRALAHNPELLILDEPVSSLDPAGRRDFLRELVNEVVDKQTTIVFSTHILSDLERIAMEVAVLNQGRIALQQPLDTLIGNTVRITGAPAALQNLPPHQVLASRPQRDGATSLLIQPDGGQRLASTPGLRVEQLGLEDLFIELTA